MLKQRVVTGVILASVVLWALLGWSDFYFALLLLLGTFTCAWEWSDLAFLRSRSARLIYSVALTAVVALGFGINTDQMLKPMVLLAALCWVVILADLYRRPEITVTPQPQWPLLVLASGILVVVVWSLFWLRQHSSAAYIIFIIAVVAAADIGAYFTGKAFGRHKLAVKISQGKTIEGALGGLALATLLALIAAGRFSSAETSVWMLLIMTLCAAFFSIVGDLFISRAKRTRGVKDSGVLLPGHGGVLDRFDGLLAAVPWMTLPMLWF